MARTLLKAAFGLIFILILSGVVHAQFPEPRVIAVNGSDQVFAQADLGILLLTIQSSAPLAADALAQNVRAAREVEAALAALGYSSDSFQISRAVFTRAGGRYYGPNQASVTGIQAEQFVYVYFRSDLLKSPRLVNEKAAAVVDALTKAGAAPANPYPQQPTAMVVYTVKDPRAYENQALQQALDRARDAAQAVAKKMGVEITGLHSISTGYVGPAAGGMTGPYPQTPQNALAALPYRFYSLALIR